MASDASSSSVVGYDAVLHDAHWEFKTNKRWTRMDEQANNFVEQQWQHFQSSSKNKIKKARFTLGPSVWGDDKSNRYEIDFLAMTMHTPETDRLRHIRRQEQTYPPRVAVNSYNPLDEHMLQDPRPSKLQKSVNRGNSQGMISAQSESVSDRNGHAPIFAQAVSLNGGSDLAMDLEAMDLEAPQGTATEHSEEGRPLRIPIIEVALSKGIWWSIPRKMSAQLFANFEAGQDAGYTWDWGDSREGSWKPDGEETSINRYMIDFVRKQQKNIDNGRMRTIRLIWILEEDATPQWTGQIPR